MAKPKTPTPTIESICGKFLEAANEIKPFTSVVLSSSSMYSSVQKAKSYLGGFSDRNSFKIDFSTAVEQRQLADLIFQKLGCGFKDIKPVLARAEMPELLEFLRRNRPQRG